MAASKEEGKCSNNDDRISMLPDELLGRVLGFLSFKEATASSILCRRWRYSWRYWPKLDFNGVRTLYRIMIEEGCNESPLKRERLKYIQWVNHVIGLCKESSSVEDFKVSFNLDASHEACINEWVRYALSKKVRTLELKLIEEAGTRSRRYEKCYTLVPYKHVDNIRHLNSLRRLCLSYVNVSGEALEFFFQHCPLLEDLSVSQSGDLLGLKITGPFPSFRQLEIALCHNIKSIEMSDVDSLVCFIYRGSKIDLRLQNVPRLTKMVIGGMLTDNMRDVLSMLSTYLPQLEAFTFHRGVYSLTWEETQMFYSAVKMRNLKQLVVNADVKGDESLMPLTNFLRASPCLQSFVVKACRISPKYVDRKVGGTLLQWSYPELKEVKFLSFCGAKSDVEFIVHLSENAAALEEIIVDARLSWGWDCDCDSMWKYDFAYKDYFMKVEGRARNRAKHQLPHLVSPTIHLKILD